jgi:Protein of unknown function (DUF3293)
MSFHPAYFDTQFVVPQGRSDWPTQFAIITAYAPTGRCWPARRNRAAHRRLRQQLRWRGCWRRVVTGYSPLSGHAEPGWAVVLPPDEAVALARRFRQDAIYWVRVDELWLVRCHSGERARVGPFRARLKKVPALGGEGRWV